MWENHCSRNTSKMNTFWVKEHSDETRMLRYRWHIKFPGMSIGHVSLLTRTWLIWWFWGRFKIYSIIHLIHSTLLNHISRLFCYYLYLRLVNWKRFVYCIDRVQVIFSFQFFFSHKTCVMIRTIVRNVYYKYNVIWFLS